VELTDGTTACTIVTAADLPHARVLARSLREHHPAVRFAALLVDGTSAGEPFEILSHADLKLDGYRSLAFRLAPDALSLRLRPRLLRHLLDLRRSRCVVYLDARLIALDPAAPHDTLPLVGVTDTPECRAMLDWLDARLDDECDAGCLDRIGVLFPSCIARDARAHLASTAGFSVDEAPADAGRRAAHERWRAEALRAGEGVFDRPPSPHERFDNGVPIPEVARRLHRRLGAAARPFGDPFATGPGSLFEWLRSPQGWSRVVEELHASHGGPMDRDAFERWLRDGGWSSLGLDPSIVRLERGPAVAVRRARRVLGEILSGDVCKICLMQRYLERYRLRGRTGRLAQRVLASDGGGGAPRRRVPDSVARLLRLVFRPCGSHPRVNQLIGTAPPAPRRAGRVPWGVNFVGRFSVQAGVGQAARATASALESAGLPHVAVNYDSAEFAGTRSDPRWSSRPSNPYAVNLLLIDIEISVRAAHQLGARFFAGRYGIAYWMWELPQFPPEWMDRFHYFDEIWAPTAFAVDAIGRSSPRPVVRMPIPILPRAAASLTRAHFQLPDDAFVFLFVFDFMSGAARKNPLAVADAFRRAFRRDDRAMLVIKSSHGFCDEETLGRLQEAQRDANIRVIDSSLSREELDSLFGTCDAYVSLHRAEGFGLTMAEAMLAGKPVIATGYSGNMDFMTPANSFPIRYRIVELDHDVWPYRRGSRWADPDPDHASSLMRHVFEHREEAARVATLGREDIARDFSVQAVGRRLQSRLATIAQHLGLRDE